MGSSPAGGTRQIQCKSARRKRAFFSKDVLQMVFPVDMSLHKKSKRFDIAFDDGQSFSSVSYTHLTLPTNSRV